MAPSSWESLTNTSAAPLRVLLIDNYDSYTYNLAHLLASVGAPPSVVRADDFDTLQAAGDYDAIVISPGPGCPKNDTSPLVNCAITQQQQHRIPLLGVCLGHQALCAAYGACVTRNPRGPSHGIVATVLRTPNSNSCALWRGVPLKFNATRYHSLTVLPDTLPQCIIPDAYSSDETLMAVHHVHYPLFGVQFHPESVASQYGQRIVSNFIAVAAKLRDARANLHQVPRTLKMKFATNRTNVTVDNTSTTLQQSPYVVQHRRLDVIHSDSEAIFRQLYSDSNPVFWLDSSTAQQQVAEQTTSHDASKLKTPRGRFSLMGDANGPYSERISYNVRSKTITVSNGDGSIINSILPNSDIFTYLSNTLSNRRTPCPSSLPLSFNGGYVGYFGYELKNQVAGIRETAHISSHPDAIFIFADRFIMIDHVEHHVHAVAITPRGSSNDDTTEGWFSTIQRKLSDTLPLSRQPPVSIPISESESESESESQPQPLHFSLERSRHEYLEDIHACLREIRAGTSYEVCLTNRIRARALTPPNPLHVYTTLRHVNPAPYSAYLRLDKDLTVCSSSPERFLRITPSGTVSSKPIKGTRPRGSTPAIDELLQESLASSAKDRSENLMIVDLVRNDLSRACIAGSVHVPRLMVVESYASVHQLVSTVQGQLAPNSNAVDAVRAAYPMGSMTGAPKVRTLDIIDRIERSARGVYSGSIGYFSLCGAADLSVVIRTAVIQKCDIEVGVGGAIVALSEPEDEYEEVLTKGRAIMKALSLAVTKRNDYLLDTD